MDVGDFRDRPPILIENLEDWLSYSEILLDFAKSS